MKFKSGVLTDFSYSLYTPQHEVHYKVRHIHTITLLQLHFCNKVVSTRALSCDDDGRVVAETFKLSQLNLKRPLRLIASFHFIEFKLCFAITRLLLKSGIGTTVVGEVFFYCGC